MYSVTECWMFPNHIQHALMVLYYWFTSCLLCCLILPDLSSKWIIPTVSSPYLKSNNFLVKIFSSVEPVWGIVPPFPFFLMLLPLSVSRVSCHILYLFLHWHLISTFPYEFYSSKWTCQETSREQWDLCAFRSSIRDFIRLASGVLLTFSLAEDGWQSTVPAIEVILLSIDPSSPHPHFQKQEVQELSISPQEGTLQAISLFLSLQGIYLL